MMQVNHSKKPSFCSQTFALSFFGFVSVAYCMV